MSETKKQNFLQGTALLALSAAAVKFIGAFYSIPLKHIIGDAGFGFYSTAYEIYTLLLMISTADQCFRENTDARKAIIRRTWENAVAAGDKNVYFLDGQTIYQDVGLDYCTVDGTHPNDLGFWCMANAIGAEIQKIMEW